MWRLESLIYGASEAEKRVNYISSDKILVLLLLIKGHPPTPFTCLLVPLPRFNITPDSPLFGPFPFCL